MIPAVLVNKSNNQIILRGHYPALPLPNGQLPLIENLDVNTEWYIVHIPFAPPVYDTRIYNLLIQEDILSIPHPIYSTLKQFQIVYSLQKRTVDELKTAVEDVENQIDNLIFTREKQLKFLTLGVGILFNELESNVPGSLVLNQKETFIKDKIVEYATKIWQNDQIARNKKTRVDSNKDISLETDWII